MSKKGEEIVAEVSGTVDENWKERNGIKHTFQGRKEDKQMEE